eukprot:GFUD01025278.1.p1 GENE.GFUD01025278.1~~GFUD01025278.1.p1  ORF type:complete len:2291 (+),score=510.26 GFUD01025278.1:413-6874(+)
MVSSLAKDRKHELSYRNIELCVKRNFGGYFGDFYPADVFLGKFKAIQRSSKEHSIQEKDLIREALTPQTKKDTRYVLLLTKNNAALSILQMPRLLGFQKFEILFGSSFPGDQEYSQICANINRIKICMETGVQVVLCNLDNLYESLYDALNQQYSYMGGSRYVDLGLGTHRVKCRVHPDFRLVLVAEDKDVYSRFPIPLINRLEKHFLGMETILQHGFTNLVDKLRLWVRSFCEVDIPAYKQNKYQQYRYEDVFVGYHEDAIPGIILELSQLEECKDEETLEQRCKERLLECATPDGVMRLKDTKLKDQAEPIFQTYFVQQTHDSLPFYVQSLPKEDKCLVQVTTHSRLLTSASKTELAGMLDMSQTAISLLSLQQFKTEEEFRKKINQFIEKIENSEGNTKKIMIVQVDAGEKSARNLVECAKYIIQGIIMKMTKRQNFKMFLVIHLPRGSSYVGYPSQPWSCVHIDELRSQHGIHPMQIRMMKDHSIYELVKSEVEEEIGIVSVEVLVESMVPKAASMIKGGNPARTVIRIDKFLNAFKSNKAFKRITLSKVVDILKKKDSQTRNSKSWLSEMSIYSTRLKEGSTYRSAVWNHLQDTITPALAGVMMQIDSNNNLDIMSSSDRWRLELFLEVYRSIDIQETYDVSLVETSKEIRLVQYGENNVSTKLPFSWILVNLIDHCCNHKDNEPSNLLEHSTLGLSLLRVFAENNTSMLKDYIHDFINLKVKTNVVEEVRLLANYLEKLVKETKITQSTIEDLEDMDLLEKDAKNNEDEIELKQTKRNKERETSSPIDVHVEFKKIEDEVGWFNSITSIYPDLAKDIEDILEKNSTLPLNLAALKTAIEKKLIPKFEVFDNDTTRESWARDVYQMQSIVEQMMKVKHVAVPVLDGNLQSIRSSWTRIQILRLFLHHVIPPNMDPLLKKTVLAKIKTVWMTLKNPDMKTHATFKNVIQVLKIINVQAAKLHYTGGVNECIRCEEIPNCAVALPCGHVGCEDCLLEFVEQRRERRCPGERCKTPKIPDDFEIKSTFDVNEAVKKHGEFRSTLNLFFMDLIDNFCFTSMEEPPEKKVLDALLEFITAKTLSGETERKGTKELSPFQEHGIDSTPVVRSFLLQLCLKCDKKLALEHIETFMAHKKPLLDCEDELIEFSQLYMNCVQDVNLQRIHSSDKDIETVLILRSIEILNENDESGGKTDFDIPSLDAFSNVRFALGQVAKVVSMYIENPDHIEQSRYMTQLITLANQFLGEGSHTAKEFLVREISMKYRADAVMEMKKYPCLVKLLPEELVKDETSIPDLFHISGKHYQVLKSQMIKSLIKNDFSEFKDHLENNPDQHQIVNVILLALYNCLYLQKEVEVTQEALSNFTNVIQEVNNRWHRFPKVQDLLNNILQSDIGAFDSNDNQSLRDMEIKKIAFFLRSNLSSTQAQNGLLEFFQELVFTPENLLIKFLPTMPHDVTFEIITEMKKEITTYNLAPKFFLCPNNHVYTIGECTKPNGKGKCADCGTDIGGQSYDQLMQGNKLLEGEKDKTRTGYTEVVEGQTKEGTREMTPFEVSILQLLIHLGLLSASLDKLTGVSNLCQRPEQDIFNYLLGKINLGITAASKYVGKSQDEILFLVSSLAAEVSKWEGNKFDLLSHQSRVDWEREFVKKIKDFNNRLEPIRNDYDIAVETDDTSSLGALHTLLHGEVHYKTAHDRLWQVRFRVTADNLMEWLVSNNQANNAQTLIEFMKKIDTVEFLRNLPAILQLQKQLVEKFTGRIALSDVEGMSIRDFYHKMEDTNKEQFIQLSEVLLQTWNNLTDKVKSFGGIMAAELAKLDMFDRVLDPGNTPAAFLFPASHGKGLCSYALAMLLIDTHNSLVRSDLPPIHPYNAGPGHLATLTKSQVQTMLLAHTRYYLQKNGVTKEEYDIVSMDRRIKEKYVQGRPRLLDTELQRIQFLEDRSGSEQRLLSSRITQQDMSNNAQYQIETELKSLPDLCQLLESVYTAKDFLLEAGGQPDLSLAKFLGNLHLYNGDIPGSTNGGPFRHLQLAHVDSLLNFLLLVRAKRMIKNGQSPFEQVIPLAYRCSLPIALSETITDCLTSIPHAWLLPNLFSFIWTRLRTQPTGDSSGQPEWPLKDTLAPHVLQGEEHCDNIHADILVKHAIDFFQIVTKAAFDF